ncbi:uncharacterized protein ACDP82_007070 isoform 2-T2 [Pangshura tecta]
MVDKTIYMNVNIGKAPLQPPDFQGQKRLRDVEEAVHQIRASLQPNTTLDTSKELDTLQLLDETQAGVRKLKAQLGNVSAANGEIQMFLLVLRINGGFQAPRLTTQRLSPAPSSLPLKIACAHTVVISVNLNYTLGLVSLMEAPSCQLFLDAPNLSGHRPKGTLAFQHMGRYFQNHP